MMGQHQLPIKAPYSSVVAEHEGIALAMLVLPPLVWVDAIGFVHGPGERTKMEVERLESAWQYCAGELSERVGKFTAKLATCVRDQGYVVTLAQPARTPSEWGIGFSFFPGDDIGLACREYNELKRVRRKIRSDAPNTALVHKYEGMYMSVRPYGWGVGPIAHEERRLGFNSTPRGLIRWHVWGLYSEKMRSLRELNRQAKPTTRRLTHEQNQMIRMMANPARYEDAIQAMVEWMRIMVIRCSYEYDTVLVVPDFAAEVVMGMNRRVLTLEGKDVWAGKTPKGEWRNEWEGADWVLQGGVIPM